MKYLFVIMLLLFSIPFFAGGPWLVPKKSGFLQLQSTFPIGSYNRLFLKNNKDVNLNRSVLDYNFQAYLEYGITNKLNLISSLPYKYISTGKATNSLSNTQLLPNGNLIGFSNLKLALKYLLSAKKINTAISVQTTLNTVNKNFEKGLITGFDANAIGLYLHVGRSFSAKFYSFLEGGVNMVANNFSNFYEIHYELGYQPKKAWWTVLTIDVRQSFNNGIYENKQLQQTGFYTNNQEYIAYGFKTAYELKNKIGFTLATFGALSGNYVAHVATVSIGIYKKW